MNEPGRRRIRRPWLAAAIVAGVAVVVFLVALASVVPFSSERARAKIVVYLSARLDSEVELRDFRIRVLPRLHGEGNGLTIRRNGRRDVPPLISVKHFTIEGNVFRLLRKRASRVTLDGLDIEIPPRDGHGDGDADDADPIPPSFVIDELVTKDARLVIVPRNKDKPPKIWAIHSLRMQSVAFDRQMPYTATLTNGVPPGEIETKGHFGPWHKGEPGDTPLDGTFTFDGADLSVFRGISGILAARGTFGGALGRIDTHGETDTPAFTITSTGHPVPLHVTYHAIVDGTNGETILERVDGSFLKTSLVAKGAVLDVPGVPGRDIKLDIVMDDARLEDLLSLAVKAPKPPMVGALALRATLDLPPGQRDVVEKLALDGQFTIANARFTSFDVQKKIEELSRRSRGQVSDPKAERVSSDFTGTFKLGEGVLTIPQVTFDVPGSTVQLAGTYALKGETLDFSGRLLMDAKVSETATGSKRMLLKVIDPLFNRKGGGSSVPITITGPRNDPSFGLDKGRVFSGK